MEDIGRKNYKYKKILTEEKIDDEASDVSTDLFQPNLSCLPTELLLRILGNLPHSDLNSIILVNKKFSGLASDPVLWKKFPVPAMEIAQGLGLDILLRVIKLPRFSKLQVLDLNRVYSGFSRKGSDVQSNQDVLQQFVEILGVAASLPLAWLDLSYNNLSALSTPDVLAMTKLVLNIQHVEMFATLRGEDSAFICNILENVSETSVLRSINLGACNLDTLPISLVTKLNCMASVTLEGSFMTVEQVKALMVEMGKGTNIKKFNIGSEPIIDIETLSDAFENLEPEVVAKALNNVEYLSYNKVKFVDGDCCDFPPDLHLASFLEVMGKNTKLKKVEMEENNFFFIQPEVVAKAFNNLEHYEFKQNPNNTSEQIVATLELMAQKTKLVDLKFIYEDLSWLNPGLVARAVVQVEQVDMLCKLSTAHVRAILGQIDDRSRIKRLNMGNNDVSIVPKLIFESALKMMRSNGGSVIVLKKGKRMFVRY